MRALTLTLSAALGCAPRPAAEAPTRTAGSEAPAAASAGSVAASLPAASAGPCPAIECVERATSLVMEWQIALDVGLPDPDSEPALYALDLYLEPAGITRAELPGRCDANEDEGCQLGWRFRLLEIVRAPGRCPEARFETQLVDLPSETPVGAPFVRTTDFTNDDELMAMDAASCVEWATDG